MIPIAAWGFALAALVLFAGALIEPPAWVRWGTVAMFAILLPNTSWSAARFLVSIDPERRTSVFLTLSAVALLVAVAGGGIGSLAALLLTLPLLLAVEWFGKERASAYMLGLFAAALLADAFVIGRQLHVEHASMSLIAVVGFLAVTARPGAALRHAGTQPQNTATASLPPEQSPDFSSIAPHESRAPSREGDAVAVAAPSPAAQEAASTLKNESESAPSIHLDPDLLGKRLQLGSRQWWRAGADNRVLAEYLLDVRASTGADEVVVWVLHDGDSILRPLSACSSNSWAERSNADKKWMAIVRWSCEASIIQCGHTDNGGGYVTAPLILDDRLLGVLCLRRTDTFAEGPEALKNRAGHHAAYIARLVSLIDLHNSSVARTEALDNALEAVRELQDHASVESPSSAICDAILHICACDASALVRWNSSSNSGTVEAGAGRFESMERSIVTSTSITGSTCQRATPFRIGAAHDMLTRLSLFKEEEHISGGELGAFCIYPMKRDGEVIGALIAAWNSPTDLTRHTAPSIEVLASVAAHALHAAWRLETVQVSARTDTLTGLCNRGFLDEQLVRVLSESSRYGDPASLILLDLDFFKAINDTHGHAVGDRVLKHVAATLLDGIRGVDLCARYGGEELAVLLPRTGLQGAVELAERLRVMVESRPLAMSTGEDIKVTASFGVASYPLQAPTPGALLSSADGALYRAKEAGRNRVRSAQHTR